MTPEQQTLTDELARRATEMWAESDSELSIAEAVELAAFRMGVEMPQTSTELGGESVTLDPHHTKPGPGTGSGGPESASTPVGGISGGSDPLNGPQTGKERLDSRIALQRVLARELVDEDACWLWEGRRDRKGYGVVDLDGRTWRAHRKVFEHFHGSIPDGLLILHSCDNPPCVNPAHLRAGTHGENMKDRTERGRSAQQQRTRCPQGHTYDEANTEWRASKNRAPYRRCRTCKRVSNIERNERMRAAARQARAEGAPPEDLSPGQQTTLQLTANGLTRGEIAKALGIDPHAVDARRSEIYRKLRVSSKQAAVERGRQLGLIHRHGKEPQ
jgi:DNA-binding CsgD family transcriptional regulator